MCDDLTAIEEDRALASKGFSRREFAAIGAAGVLTACATVSGLGDTSVAWAAHSWGRAALRHSSQALRRGA